MKRDVAFPCSICRRPALELKAGMCVDCLFTSGQGFMRRVQRLEAGIRVLAAECQREVSFETRGCEELRADNDAALVCITRANLWARMGERLLALLKEKPDTIGGAE